MLILLKKSHVDAYTRRDGVHVRAHDRRPMYVSRKVLNGHELHAWAVRQGFKNVTPADKMHVTVAYSRAPVHHESVAADGSTMMAAPRSLGHLGDEGAVVLHVDHPRLHDRWSHMLSHGASWDHEMGEGYKPHVSISYKGQPIPDGLQPFDGELHLGPEVVEDLKSGWGSGVAKESEKAGPVLFTKARVGAYLRGGKLVNLSGYQGRDARAQPAPGQMALFTSAEAPPSPPKPNPFRDKDPVLDTPDMFDGRTPREREASRPPANGEKFGTFYHGTARPFESFDADKLGKDGAGYNHQGVGVYLTDDPHGLGRFFARSAAVKVSVKDRSLSREESDKLANSDGVMMRVKLAPDARILDMRDGKVPADIQSLFDRSVGDKESYTKLRETVLARGYDGIAFHEPNAPDGWETKKDATTIVVYDHTKAKVIDHQDASDFDKRNVKAAAPVAPAKPHPLERARAELADDRARLAEAKAKGDESGARFLEHVIEGREGDHAKLEAAFAAHAKHGDGTELSNTDGRRHAILLPDASNPGKYRYQMFDERGFMSHSTHDTPEEAVADAALSGYHVHNPGILDKLAGTDEWSHGMAINAIMQAHNGGQIDWATAMGRINKLHEEREGKKAPAEAKLAAPAEPAPAEPADNHPSKPTRSLLNLVPEDRRDEWLDLHRRQHEIHHYDLGQIREKLEKARAPMRRALTTLRESEAAAAEARKGGDLPGTDERIRLADNAVMKNSIEFQRHSKEVERLKQAHQESYERVAKLGRQKDAIASPTGDVDIDWASMKQRAPEDQAKYEKTMLAAYRQHYKSLRGKPMRKSWDWLGTEPMQGQVSIFNRVAEAPVFFLKATP